MNPLFINMLISKLGQLANMSDIIIGPINAIEASKIREEIYSVAISIQKDEPIIYSQLTQAKDMLFNTDQFGRIMLNTVAMGEVIFGLNHLCIKQQAHKNDAGSETDIWSYVHPIIKKTSKKLYEDGHFANAAEDAFIEINDRVKKIYKIISPSATKIPDGDTAMTTVFSANNPMLKACDISSETGMNEQKGLMLMLQGAMSALRNPKAHSNITISKDDAMRRIMYASMLMYKIDEAVKYSKIKE